MNYLAHLFLSCESEERMIGNFITDQISMKESLQFEGGVQEGILLHRAIDTFTDQHPAVKEFIKYIRPQQGKYAPVVVDIYFDYLLYLAWDKYSHRPFDYFCELMYEIIPKYTSIMPAKIRPRVKKMVSSKWLTVYTSQPGLQSTFNRLEKRLTFSNNINDATPFLFENLNTCSQFFDEFFPDLVDFVEAKCGC